MHHTLKLYARYREHTLRYYMFQASWVRIPLVGRFVRWVGNKYGEGQHAAYVLTQEEARQLVELSPVLALGPCACREVFRNCDGPVSAEIMLAKDHNPFVEGRPDKYRSLTREEARDVLDSCRRSGLVPTVIKCRENFYAICNCCSCCCVPMRLRSKYGIGKALVRNADILGEFRAWLAA